MRRLGRIWKIVAIAIAVTLVASSCYYELALQHEANDPTTRPWWCHSTGDGGHHVDPAYAGMTKGMLSWEDCTGISANFDVAIDYANNWPTLGDAESGGFHRIVNYVGGMGTHHTVLGDYDPRTDPNFDPEDPSFPGTELDEKFKAHKPEFLMYDGNSPDSELVGFAWFVKSDSTTPPEGFQGDNDWWHRHHDLCHSTTTWRVMGEDRSDQWCQSVGGVNVDYSDWWMTHAWIVDGWTTQSDVFTNHHPCLHPGGPATDPDDPCWDEAMGGGGHGGH